MKTLILLASKLNTVSLELLSSSPESHPPKIHLDYIKTLESELKGYINSFESSTEGVIRTSREGRFLKANPAFAKMLGYDDVKDLIDSIKSISVQIYVDSDIRLDFMRELDVKGEARCEYQAWKKDGSTTWLFASARIVRGDNDEFLYYESIVNDVSERRAREFELQKLASSLKDSNMNLANYARLVAHDISQPLDTLYSYSQLMMMEFSDSLPDQLNSYLDVIFKSAGRMRKVVSDVLEASRHATGEITFETLDLSAIVESVLDDLEILISNSGAKIKLDPLPAVLGNKPKLYRLFQNLISNALKFSRDVAPLIEISHENRNGNIVYSVKDNGIGMKPEFIENIFQMFVRAPDVHNRPGSGMGLTICKNIVEAHHGKIWVTSKPNEGTTFYFTLSDC